MAGLFICPHCGAATQVATEFAGRSGPCAHCGRLIAIPADLADGTAPAARRTSRARSSARVWAAVGLLSAAALAGLFIGGSILFSTLRAWMELDRCAAQLRKLGIALDGYYDDYSAYPPAVVRGQRGESLHSWRVLLLPYLGKEEEALYKEYHFEEPWNGPHNRELADLMPEAYACHCDPAAFESSQTSYLAVVDGKTGDFAAPPQISEANRPPRAKRQTQPPTKYLIVEVAESGVNWMEPRDLVLGGALRKLAQEGDSSGFSCHVGGVNALVCDGTTETLTEEAAQRALGPKSQSAR